MGIHHHSHQIIKEHVENQHCANQAQHINHREYGIGIIKEGRDGDREGKNISCNKHAGFDPHRRDETEPENACPHIMLR